MRVCSMRVPIGAVACCCSAGDDVVEQLRFGGGGWQHVQHCSILYETTSTEKWECTHLGRVRVDFSAVILGLRPTYIHFVAALLDVFHGGNFQHIMDDGQKFHTIPQQLLADAFTCRLPRSFNACIIAACGNSTTLSLTCAVD